MANSTLASIPKKDIRTASRTQWKPLSRSLLSSTTARRRLFWTAWIPFDYSQCSHVKPTRSLQSKLLEKLEKKWLVYFLLLPPSPVIRRERRGAVGGGWGGGGGWRRGPSWRGSVGQATYAIKKPKHSSLGMTRMLFVFPADEHLL